MSYARQLITLEQRNQVLNIMKRFRLPLWHAVCHPSLFIKVCPAICTPPRQHSSANLLSFAQCNLQLLTQGMFTLSGRHHGGQSVATITLKLVLLYMASFAMSRTPVRRACT